MKLYVHKEGAQELDLVDFDERTKVTEIAEKHGGGEATVWLESADQPLEAELTLLEAGVADRGHVFVGKRPRIAVRVNFMNDHKGKNFKPSKTVDQVYRWASGPKGYDLDKRERPEHGLVVCGADVLAPTDAHIGSLTDSAELCFDLVPKRRFEGAR